MTNSVHHPRRRRRCPTDRGKSCPARRRPDRNGRSHRWPFRPFRLPSTAPPMVPPPRPPHPFWPPPPRSIPDGPSTGGTAAIKHTVRVKAQLPVDMYYILVLDSRTAALKYTCASVFLCPCEKRVKPTVGVGAVVSEKVPCFCTVQRVPVLFRPCPLGRGSFGMWSSVGGGSFQKILDGSLPRKTTFYASTSASLLRSANNPR